jgi:hypothetical protein
MDIVTFRQSFPEFNDVAQYPDHMLSFWATVAGVHVSESKWGDVYTVGMSLALAHYLVLANNNRTEAGITTGPVNSESTGDISTGYDTSASLEEKAGQWNLTSYGKQFIRMARLIGGVAIQIN